MIYGVRRGAGGMATLPDLIEQSRDNHGKPQVCFDKVLKNFNHFLLTIVNEVAEVSALGSIGVDRAVSSADALKLRNLSWQIIKPAARQRKNNVIVSQVMAIAPSVIGMRHKSLLYNR
jgi:hypothetical protein